MQLSLMAKSVSSAEKKWPTSARNRMGTAKSWCPMRLVALVSPEGRNGLAGEPCASTCVPLALRGVSSCEHRIFT